MYQNPKIPLILGSVLALCLISCSKPNPEPRPLNEKKLGYINQSLIHQNLETSRYHFKWLGEDINSLQLYIKHKDLEQSWNTPAGIAFIYGAHATVFGEEFAGSFGMKEELQSLCQQHSVDSWELIEDTLEIQGKMLCGPEKSNFSLKLIDKGQHLALKLGFSDPKIGRSEILLESSNEERIFGLGEQFSAFDFKGKRVPILVSEQGLARGLEPLTTILNTFGKGSGGYWFNSYAPIPHFISSKLRSIALENTEYSIFDFRNNDRIHIQSYSPKLKARLIFGAQPLDLISEYSKLSGKMRALPEWVNQGVILGLQGGSDKVMKQIDGALAAGAQVSGVWIQDWQGQRETPLGRRLWWNWELDPKRYTDFEQFKTHLATKGIRVLGYINPFLVDAREKGEFKRNLYQEALDGGYLLKNTHDDLVFISQGSFKAYMVDFSNQDAREWYKGVIKDELLGAGLSGWMADFGEALPLDSKLSSGESALSAHNQYPVEWAKINREAIREFGSEQDTLFFMRSAFTNSPEHSTLFWLGDQATNWDNYDGIKTSVTGLLTSGLSGFSFNHGDVGGYFSARLPFGISEHRSKELLMRWIELGAFQPVFRTHEGLLPDQNAHFDSDPELLEHFAKFSKVYKAWGEYRKQLVKEAAEFGWPVLRHPFVHQANDPNFWSLSYQQYQIGEALWFAPVLDPGKNSVEIRLPKGNWVHAFTGEIHISSGSDKTLTISAPIGTPALLYNQGSPEGQAFREQLIKEGITFSTRESAQL